MLDDARIFHVNVNCANLERSRRFYVGALGLVEGAHTAPERAQPGAAFGFDRAWWDALILIGERGFEGGAIDLLSWREPASVGAPPGCYFQCGFQRLGLAVPDLDAAMARAALAGGRAWSAPVEHGGPPRPIRLVHLDDPDGVALELFEGGGPSLAFVSVVCADLARSLDWYLRLGFQEVARFPTRTSDGAHLHVDGPVDADEIFLAPPGGGAVHLILSGFRTPRAIAGSVRTLHTIGIARTALLVSDLDVVFAKLRAAEIICLSSPVTAEMGPGLPALRFVCFAGPDGEVLELIQRPA
jgi:catechol 2,3-dioxygenase-like lactoylglutathione lyase family enzyme